MRRAETAELGCAGNRSGDDRRLSLLTIYFISHLLLWLRTVLCPPSTDPSLITPPETCPVGLLALIFNFYILDHRFASPFVLYIAIYHFLTPKVTPPWPLQRSFLSRARV